MNSTSGKISDWLNAKICNGNANGRSNHKDDLNIDFSNGTHRHGQKFIHVVSLNSYPIRYAVHPIGYKTVPAGHFEVYLSDQSQSYCLNCWNAFKGANGLLSPNMVGRLPNLFRRLDLTPNLFAKQSHLSIPFEKRCAGVVFIFGNY
jgi:hypothetical protein